MQVYMKMLFQTLSVNTIHLHRYVLDDFYTYVFRYICRMRQITYFVVFIV
jgi:hypothetical protein